MRNGAGKARKSANQQAGRRQSPRLKASRPSSEPRWSWRWLPYALVIVTALLVHSPSLDAPFHFDDLSLPGDPDIGRPDGWVQILTDPARTRPLTYLTFWLNERLHGFTPAGFHAVNLGLFGILLVIVAALYRKLVPQMAAVGALAVFALHPLQTEAVAYVFARATLLTAVFVALAWLAWASQRKWLAVACFALAMGAKEEAAALPVFLAGYELCWRKASLRESMAPLGAMVAIVMLAGARLFYAVTQTPGSGVGAEATGISPWNYLLTQGRAIGLYMRLLVAPYGQTFDRDFPVSAGLDFETVWAWAGLSLMVGAALLLLRRRPEVYWWVGGLLLLAPTSSLIPLTDLTAERRMLLPLLSISLGIGLLLKRLPIKKAIGVFLIGVVAMGVASWRRTQVWRTEVSLWTDAVEKAPRKVRPKLQLARALEPKGAASEAQRLSLLEQSHGLEPSNPAPIAELGVFHLQRSSPDKALAAFERALELSPGDPQIRANIGSSQWLLGRRAVAINSFRKALEIDPCTFDARNNLILAMRAMGSTAALRELAVAPEHCRFSAAQRAALEKAR